MPVWKDYYQILDVDPKASAEEIKKAYRYKTFILHSDRFQGAPESTRLKAGEELRNVNEAYEILDNQQKRKDYDRSYGTGQPKQPGSSATNPPRPMVSPATITLKDGGLGEIKTASFVINNSGGPYHKIKVEVSHPNSWVKLGKCFSLSNSDELPLQVEIEAMGEKWNETFTETIKVGLDGEVTYLTVTLQTRPEPINTKAKNSGTYLLIDPPFVIFGIIVAVTFIFEWWSSRKNTPPIAPPTAP
jgi:hypothetical protein